MNFQPSDYLNGLNLEFEEDFNNNDLDLFSKNDFFNLDNFKVKSDLDFLSPVSPKEPQVNIPQPQEIVNIKQESAPLDSFPTPVSPDALRSENKDFKSLDNAKVTALEDKKRRNTAASARFRIKKKLKEQQMESKSKELQDKVYSLEKKLMTLEMENKCLKKLIIEKNNIKNDELLQSIKNRSMESKPFFEYTK
ncbi:hypothetical protein CLIB1444_06S01090 [[Candida] jaroonii]|uniref:Uncharacterized protein n=1 Tax=[Candida] jaroonii TaxID=467808 RepID=A0ACA9Y986_9ASCO|nr:hypothetical protein CLIB1444_06S01090 [[Candida] jaroonii]